MKDGKFKCLLGIFFIAIVIITFSSNTIYALTNKNYGDPTAVMTVDLDEKATEAELLPLLAKFLYWLASSVESIVGDAFAMLTGTNEFPWADRVIFNSIAFLDINFMNPASGSLFKNSSGSNTALSDVILKIYGSVMTMAIGFLGVIVAIMSIKLAFSVIASEKAKYKQAIVKFSVSIVMLFCIHYGIAIVFYMNEKMVEIASTILIDTISENNFENNLDLSTKLGNDKLVQNYLNLNSEVSGEPEIGKAMYISENGVGGPTQLRSDIINYLDGKYPFDSYDNLKKYIAENEEIAASLIKALRTNRYKEGNDAGKDGNRNEWNQQLALRDLAFDIWLVSGILDDPNNIEQRSKELIAQYHSYAKEIVQVFSDNTDVTLAEQFWNKKTAEFLETDMALISDEKDYDGYMLTLHDDTFNELMISGEGPMWSDVEIFSLMPTGLSTENKILYGYLATRRALKQPYFNKLINLYKGFAIEPGQTDPLTGETYQNPSFSTDAIAIISTLSNYFKDAAWGYATDDDGEIIGWRTSNLSVSGAIIYAIFVVQSLMFFFAYIKRFFYVTILALLAPVIVIYDFLVKAIM